MTHKIGEMFVLGFRTPEIPEWLHSFASKFGLGGVILFDYDVTIKKYERNIFDKAQVKKLCKEIHALPSRPLIYVDQEGGKVRRLKDKYGFAPLPSAKQMGTMSKADRLAALKPAYAEMKEVGIDVNLAPVIDLDFNPTSPDIGSAERSFSADVKVVEECVKQIAEVANANGIQLCLKHFPGTGAARANPHDELMDLSKYTSDDQVNIFRTLLPMVPMALFSHGLVNQWEKNTPVCLSKYAVNMFRGWDPDAVVLTDDLQMQGVQKLMNTETACVRALEAGADVILLGHNMLDEQAKSVQFAWKVANAVESDPRCRANFEASLKRIQKMKAAAQHEHRLLHSPASSPKSG